MRYRLVWLLAGVASFLIIAAVAVLWRWQHAAVAITVGIPAAAALLAPLLSWAFSAHRSGGRPTSEQSNSAKQAVADRALEQWREAAEAEPALRGSVETLGVNWTVSAIDGTPSEANGPGSGTATVATIAARLRDEHPCRLIVLGAAGSGKTTFTRLLIVELLKHARPGDQVPVFLPVSSWDPDRESLHEWMVRRITDEVPGLDDSSSYGPLAVASLINRGMVLPILDGLDLLSHESRRSALSSGDLLVQNRFVLTCREEEFRAVSGSCPITDALILTPGRVNQTEMMRFLRQVTESPHRWDELFGQLALHPHVAAALSDPRMIYLASIVYEGTESKPGDLILLESYSDPCGRTEDYLRTESIKVRTPLGVSVEGTHWGGDKARKWLAFLADLPRDASRHGATVIAWWRLYCAQPWLRRSQALVRASLGGLIAWLLVILILGGRYGQLTGLAYGLAIFTACLFLSSSGRQIDPSEYTRPSYWWWIPVAWHRSRRLLCAGVAAFCCFGFFIGLRVGLASDVATGFRAGVANGLAAGMIVILAAVIAGVPSPPRGELGTGDLSRGRPKAPPIGIALGLGVSFGLLSGIVAVYKHQGVTGPDLRHGIIYGLIMGLDFGVGTWLTRRVRTRFAYREAEDPLSDFRAERTGALLVPVILGITFATAFGLSANLTWSLRTGIMNGIIGIIVGGLTSDMSLYLITVVCLAVAKKLPFRAMKFLELCCRQRILRPALHTYQFSEDPDRLGLATGKPA